MSPFFPTLVTSARSTTRISGAPRQPSERLLVAVEPGRGRGPGGRVRRLAALAALAALVAAPGVGLLAVGGRAAGLAPAPPVGLLRAGDRPPHARADLVGHHLDLRALLPVLGLPRPLLEPARDDHPVALAERVGDVGAEVAPADDVEEGGRLLPGLALPV